MALDGVKIRAENTEGLASRSAIGNQQPFSALDKTQRTKELGTGNEFVVSEKAMDNFVRRRDLTSVHDLPHFREIPLHQEQWFAVLGTVSHIESG